MTVSVGRCRERASRERLHDRRWEPAARHSREFVTNPRPVPGRSELTRRSGLGNRPALEELRRPGPFDGARHGGCSRPSMSAPREGGPGGESREETSLEERRPPAARPIEGERAPGGWPVIRLEEGGGPPGAGDRLAPGACAPTALRRGLTRPAHSRPVGGRPCRRHRSSRDGCVVGAWWAEQPPSARTTDPSHGRRRCRRSRSRRGAREAPVFVCPRRGVRGREPIRMVALD